MLKKEGLEISGADFDLMLAAYLLNPAYGSDDMKAVVDNFTANELPFYEHVYGANKKMAVPALDVYAKYSLEKCGLLKRLEKGVREELLSLEMAHLYEIEQELSEVLAEMEFSGLLVDLERLEAIGRELEKRRKSLLRRFTISPGRNSISILRNNWEKSCLRNSIFPTANAAKPAIPQAFPFWKSWLLISKSRAWCLNTALTIN